MSNSRNNITSPNFNTGTASSGGAELLSPGVQNDIQHTRYDSHYQCDLLIDDTVFSDITNA